MVRFWLKLSIFFQKYIDVDKIASYLKTTWQTFWPEKNVEIPEEQPDEDAAALYNS